MKNNVYATMAKRLRRIKEQGKFVLDKNELTRDIDISGMPREELERRFLSATASCVFYAQDFRSPLRGCGIYVPINDLDNPVFLNALFENSDMDAQQKVSVCKRLAKLSEESLAEHPDYAQMYFDIGEGGKPVFKEDFTKTELLEMLRKAAGGY